MNFIRTFVKKIVGYPKYYLFQLLVEDLKLLNNTKILELGCGDGWATLKIAQQFNNNLEIVGIDSSLKNINKANIHLNNLKLKESIKFINCDASMLPFENQTFDIIFSFSSFHHFNNPLKIIKEVKRVLRYKGKFIIVDHCNDYKIMQLLNIIHKLKEVDHRKYFLTKELFIFLENNKFKNIQIKQNKPNWFWGFMRICATKE